MRRAVMVSGAGRSGTSTVAGSLTRLGLHVPQPEVPADSSNPRGFYETQWVVDFHKRMLDRGPVVRTIDSRPEAVALASRHALDPNAIAELDAWLAEQSVHEQLVVKDPRAFWFHDLWRAGMRARGAELTFLTMLRHPVEVAKSRDTYYVADREERFRRLRATANVAGWCNVTLAADEVTRGDRRVFVRYTDLLTDWRDALSPVAERLGLEFNADLTSPEHHAVDDFIDSGLRRSQTSWDDYDMPPALVDLAENLWTQMNALVADPDDAAALAAVDELKAQYAAMHDQAVAIALDHTGTREVFARRQARREMARQREEAKIRRRVGRALKRRREVPEDE